MGIWYKRQNSWWNIKENLPIDNISEEKLVKNEKEFKGKIQDSDAHNALKDKLSLDKVIQLEPFIEIAPLDHDFEAATQKDLSSVPLSEVKLPDVVYLIVKKEKDCIYQFLFFCQFPAIFSVSLKY